MKKKKRRRLTLRQIKEILRLKRKGLSNRQIAKICNISPTTVEKYIERIEAASVSYDDMKEKSEDEVSSAFLNCTTFSHQFCKLKSISPAFFFCLNL